MFPLRPVQVTGQASVPESLIHFSHQAHIAFLKWGTTLKGMFYAVFCYKGSNASSFSILVRLRKDVASGDFQLRVSQRVISSALALMVE